MLTIGSYYSGRCSRPETKTEPAKEKVEYGYDGGVYWAATRVGCNVYKWVRLSTTFLSYKIRKISKYLIIIKELKLLYNATNLELRLK